MVRLYGNNSTAQGFSKELFLHIKEGLILSKEKPEGYSRVLIAPYIRTMSDNLVVVHEGNISPVSDPVIIDDTLYPNYLIDSGLLVAKNLVESAFIAKSDDAIMRVAKKSTCFPVGAVAAYCSLIVVFNIVVADDLFRDPEIALCDGFRLCPIETYHPKAYTQGEIAKSLVLVKAEEGK